jgi:uncharacterized OB-fold protein
MAPTRVLVRDGLFTDDPPALLGSQCDACGAHHFPRHDTCPYCATEGARAVTLSNHGILWSWTAVTAPPPGYRGTTPYGMGVVELPEGIRVITRLTESDPAHLESGQPVDLQVVPLHTDDEGREVLTFAFAPSGSS